MELLAPPIPGQPPLSLDKIVGRDPSLMTSIFTDGQERPAELAQESWWDPPAKPGKLPEHLRPPQAAVHYCPLDWPRTLRPVTPLKPLRVPLPLLQNCPVPYYLPLPLPSCPPQYRATPCSRATHRATHRATPCSRDTPSYCPVLPEEFRTSDPREPSKFKAGSKIRHMATGCRTRLDSEGSRAGGRRRRAGEGPAVAERALSEYSHIMEALGSKVTGTSEVVEEGSRKFTEYLNQLCQQKEFVTQVLAVIDMRCVRSLLSPEARTHITQ